MKLAFPLLPWWRCVVAFAVGVQMCCSCSDRGRDESLAMRLMMRSLIIKGEAQLSEQPHRTYAEMLCGEPGLCRFATAAL
jgi:hypothetical protein